MTRLLSITAMCCLFLLSASCGGDDGAASSTSISTTPAATVETRAPSASSTLAASPTNAPTATSASGEGGASPTGPVVADLTAVAEAMFPTDPQFGDYLGCDRGAPPSSYDSCPITSRLKARLISLDASGPEYLASRICRCQNSSNTRDIVVSASGTGGTATVSLFGGTRKFDLLIVRGADGQLLVDDIFYTGCQQSSWYVDSPTCVP
jgi:hypothetical protein